MLSHFRKTIRYIHRHVLGINLRNSEFIFEHNPKPLYPLVDNKILTKNALKKFAVPMPETYFTATSFFELRHLEKNLKSHDSFVIKPANGFGGEGILVVVENHSNTFRLVGDKAMSLKDMRAHLEDILSGMYSLNQLPDHVLCEYKISAPQDLCDLSYKGIPDVRILVFRGIPVMSMLRLSTQASNGKANLHQGGIGVGIDLTSGKTTSAFHKNHYITHHPDSGLALTDYTIPHWEKLLDIAATCYRAVPLGYLGVDITFDKDRGPLVLELNARPGLQLQMANRMGVRPILEKLQNDHLDALNNAERLKYGQKLFCEAMQRNS
jgi:alpha-L-glutamate ligase-like protein